jgi:hypothetical protein
MMSVVMLSVILLNVTYKPFMLNVIMLDVVAPVTYFHPSLIFAGKAGALSVSFLLRL